MGTFNLENNINTMTYDCHELAYMYEKKLYSMYENGTLQSSSDDILFSDNLNIGSPTSVLSKNQLINKIIDTLENELGDLNYITDKETYHKAHNTNNQLIKDLFPNTDIKSNASWKRFLYNNVLIVPVELMYAYSTGGSSGNSTIKLKNILQKDGAISDRIKEGPEAYKAVFLPMIEDAYKKMPYSAKLFFYESYYTIDIWSDQIIPRYTSAGKFWDIASIIGSIISAYTMSTFNIFPQGLTGTAAQLAETASFLAKVALVSFIGAQVLNLLGSYLLKGAIAQQLLKLARIASTISTVAGIGAGICAGLSSFYANGFQTPSLDLTTMEGVKNVLKYTNMALDFISKAVEKYFNQQLGKLESQVNAQLAENKKLQEENEELLEELIQNSPIAVIAKSPEFYYKEVDDFSTNLIDIQEQENRLINGPYNLDGTFNIFNK